MEYNRSNEVQLVSRFVSYSHLDFFFGAAVNVRAIRQMKDLKMTIEL